ncbi:hypothetical protein CC85DRAFT_310359 [Cutaneotrichosporon oleaginosum]|uniref:Uncharacterized protein n=1 Tax=Cutaneotrichosporon oleaginosum TaxID=879819 RepID=A0A0J0XYC0_9TREE|nr:uncharacterized protein CC85DRAFT_310359 [Cutaneotrichosporon oleaginosum]KLT46036.1 hypothetical protein CC85DRAFT_310359 [Cutaneotrichosporon oleaginosum]TXT06730.1 hypothetical protein COLE_06061 [Cutaneotrichosporon oleaginosum]
MRLPPDILVRVADLLAARGARGTLAALARASRAAYDAAAPALYREVVLGPRAVGLLSALAPGDVGLRSDEATRRRLRAWRYVRRVRVPTLADAAGFADVAVAAAAAAAAEPLMPRLQSVCLGPVAVDQLRIWTGPLPGLLQGLAAQRPTRLCVAFRHVPAAEWDAYREASTRGAYALVRRLEALTAGWDLVSVTFHDVVHQVLPSLPTTNVYDFAPHAIPHPLFRGRYRFPVGEAAVRLPGPEWNMRPWQMGTAIKNLFPSSAVGSGVHYATLQRTRWRFCGVANHVLTKEEREDDDSDGVWYREVKGMVDESIRTGIARDLPARGLDAEFVHEVLERLEYGRVEECSACGRDEDEHNVMSMDGLDLL